MKTFPSFLSLRCLPFGVTAIQAVVAVCGFAVTGQVRAATAIAPAAAGTQFVNTAMAPRNGTFTVTSRAVPSASPMDGTFGLSLGSQTAFAGLAAVVRFGPAGNIDARNGASYSSASIIPYAAGVAYDFRLVVSVPTHTYSIYVTPPGGPELTVGSDYAFRLEQNTVANVNNWVITATNPPGGATLTVDNFAIDGAPAPEPFIVAAPAFSPAGGTYSAGQTVTITSATSGATIRYTTDGSTPTATTGTLYTAPISISAAATLKAIAYAGSPDAPVNVGSYAVAAAIVDPNYTGSAGGTLVIAPGVAAVALDGLNQVYDGQPKPVTATTSPTGLALTLTYDGSATPPTVAGRYAVVAMVNSGQNYTGSASSTLTIARAPLAIALGNLNQTYDGSPKSATVTTIPAGVAVVLTYDSGSAPPNNAGSYVVRAVSSDSNYDGSATGILTISKATAGVTLGNLVQTYDGTAKPVNVTTNPAGLAVTLSYGTGTGSAPPINAGSYPVSVTVVDANYAGSASGTLEIARAAAFVVLSETSVRYDGMPKTVSVTTTPQNLPVTIAYNGAATPPVYPGSYAVAATVVDVNYSGSVAGVFDIGIAALVRHGLVLNGDLDGSAQILLAENSTLNGQAFLSGDLLVPGAPVITLNGNPTYGGTIEASGSATPASYTITLNGGALLRHVVRRVDPIAMPVVAAPPAPAGTRNVAINNSTESAGDFATLRNLTLNGNAGVWTIPAGTYGSLTANGNASFVLGIAGATEPAVYNLQSLVLNGNSELRLAGPVVITLANGTAFNGPVNATGDSVWLTLRLASGGVTLNGHVRLNGTVIAPSGTVVINGNTQLMGRVVADRLTINGNGLLTDPDL